MDDRYIILTLRFGDKEIRIAKDSVFRLLAGGLKGVEAADYELSTEKSAGMDGEYVQTEKFGPRSIGIEFSVADRARTEDYRDLLMRYINPRREGTLIVERNGVRRKIGVKMDGRMEFDQANIITDRLHVSLNLFCPDPWFYDAEETERGFIAHAPLLTFPFNSVVGVGITSGATWTTDALTINNDGDAPMGVMVDIVADGPITNPGVKLDDKAIKAICSMQGGDKLHISTVERQKTIELNDGVLLNYDRQSVFFQVPPGNHTLIITADSGVDKATSKVTYAMRYLGV